MKGKTHDLTFSAHTINCLCHSIRSMFRVLGVYNFDHFMHFVCMLRCLQFDEYLHFYGLIPIVLGLSGAMFYYTPLHYAHIGFCFLCEKSFNFWFSYAVEKGQSISENFVVVVFMRLQVHDFNIQVKIGKVENMCVIL